MTNYVADVAVGETCRVQGSVIIAGRPSLQSRTQRTDIFIYLLLLLIYLLLLLLLHCLHCTVI